MMKNFILLICLLLMSGVAGAVTVSNTDNIKNFGNAMGFKNAGTIQAADLYATDDFKVGDDAQIGGDLEIAGASSFAALYLSSTLGVAGTSGLNYTTVTDLRASDDGYILDAFGVGGTAGLNYTTVTDIRASDDAYVTDVLGVGGTAALNVTTATSVTATGLVQGADGRMTDDFLVDDDAYVDGTATLNDAVINTTLDVNGATTAENISITQGRRIVLNTAGTQFIEHNETGNYFGIWGNPLAVDGFRWTGTLAPTSGSDMIAVGAGSDIDYTLSSGVLVTPTGAATLQGNTTVSANKALAVTTADKLTVGGNIIPQEMVINWPISASSVDENIFVADDAWQITKIEEVHAVAGTEAAPALFNATVVKLSGVTAPASGSPMHNSTITLSAAANTVITPTLSTIAANSTLADGDKIGINYQGTGTSLAGGVITIHIRRV